jgi:hypothetical protein
MNQNRAFLISIYFISGFFWGGGVNSKPKKSRGFEFQIFN